MEFVLQEYKQFLKEPNALSCDIKGWELERNRFLLNPRKNFLIRRTQRPGGLEGTHSPELDAREHSLAWGPVGQKAFKGRPDIGRMGVRQDDLSGLV